MSKDVFIPSQDELLAQFYEVVLMVEYHNGSDERNEQMVEQQYASIAQLIINMVLCAPHGHIAFLLKTLKQEAFAKDFGMVCEKLLHSEYCAPMSQKIASSLGIAKKVAFFKFQQSSSSTLPSEAHYWGRYFYDLVKSGIGMDIVFLDATYDEVGVFEVQGPAK